MSKTVELHAEIVENDAGDIVMRLKDRKGVTDHLSSCKRGVRTKGLQEAEGDPRPGTTEADRGQPAVGLAAPLRLGREAIGIRQSGAGPRSFAGALASGDARGAPVAEAPAIR
jgi:hypothetical protein